MPNQPSDPGKNKSSQSSDHRSTLKQTDDKLAFMGDISHQSHRFNSSTISKLLICKDYNLEPTDPLAASLTVRDIKARQSQKLIQEQPNQIQKTINQFDTQIAQLDALNSREASVRAQELISYFAPLRADGTERLQQREKLYADLDHYINTIRSTLRATVSRRQAGASWSDILEDFKRIATDSQAMTEAISKLSRNERATVQNLTAMVRKVTDVLNAERSRLNIPITPEMQRGPE